MHRFGLKYGKTQNLKFFGHPQNVLATMLADSNQAIRQKAVNLILEKRQKSLDFVQPIRKFLKPKLSFDAPAYHEMNRGTKYITKHERLRRIFKKIDNRK